jgi:DNA-binding transcriptional MerR regulator
MHIGEVARQAGFPVDTVRFYERRGLLTQAPRSEGGFRLYTNQDLGTLRLIQRIRGLGFSLAEVRDFLSLRTSQYHACHSVKAMLAGKLQEVRKRVEEFRRLERELAGALRRCDDALKRGRKNATPCPVLAGGCANRKGGRNQVGSAHTRSGR